MFNRVIALTLIAAVFGCPLWCSMGLCQCSGDTTALNGSAIECCCGASVNSPTGNTDQPSSKRTEIPSPDPEPESLRCQGICGGAVLESPYQIPEADVYRLLTRIENGSYLFFPIELGVVWKAGLPESPPAAYRGRLVRIRLMSFQC